MELVGIDESTAFFDLSGDGFRNNVGRVAADDGLLAYDKDGDGAIAARNEISFVEYVEGAETDLECLAHFDTNDDGVLDDQDAEFSKFGVWQDLDQDGETDPGEFQSLTATGASPRWAAPAEQQARGVRDALDELRRVGGAAVMDREPAQRLEPAQARAIDQRGHVAVGVGVDDQPVRGHGRLAVHGNGGSLAGAARAANGAARSVPTWHSECFGFPPPFGPM